MPESIRILGFDPGTRISGYGIIDAQAGGELSVVSYGAIGVGGIKMKIHRSCVASLFEANDRVLDADEMLAVGRSF